MATPTPTTHTKSLGTGGTTIFQSIWTAGAADNFVAQVVIDLSGLPHTGVLSIRDLDLFCSPTVSASLYLKQDVQDTNQGVVTYQTNDLRDTTQVFADWATTSGDAVYLVVVTDADGDISWGYLGGTASATQIHVYQNRALTTAGWNGDGGTGTPSTYEVRRAQYDLNPASSSGKGILIARCPLDATAVGLNMALHPSCGPKADGDLVVHTTSAADGDEMYIRVNWESI